ncbi:TPA: hypothetical protein I0I20_RS09205 [Enterococcus faecium]
MTKNQCNSNQFKQLVQKYAETHFNQSVSFYSFQQWLVRHGYELLVFTGEEAQAKFVMILHCLYECDFVYRRQNQRIQTIFTLRAKKKRLVGRADFYSVPKRLIAH